MDGHGTNGHHASKFIKEHLEKTFIRVEEHEMKKLDSGFKSVFKLESQSKLSYCVVMKKILI